MKNIERLAKHVAKNGIENIMVHTITGTTNWVVCQKIEDDKWLVTLGNPMGNVTYNLGTVTNAQHLQLWNEITRMEIESKTNQILLAKDLKRVVRKYTAIKKFIKINENQGTDSKIKGRKSRKRHPRIF